MFSSTSHVRKLKMHPRLRSQARSPAGLSGKPMEWRRIQDKAHGASSSPAEVKSPASWNRLENQSKRHLVRHLQPFPIPRGLLRKFSAQPIFAAFGPGGGGGEQRARQWLGDKCDFKVLLRTCGRSIQLEAKMQLSVPHIEIEDAHGCLQLFDRVDDERRHWMTAARLRLRHGVVVRDLHFAQTLDHRVEPLWRGFPPGPRQFQQASGARRRGRFGLRL